MSGRNIVRWVGYFLAGYGAGSIVSSLIDAACR